MTFYGSVNERQRKDQFVNDTIWWCPPQRNVKDMSHRSITRINWRMFMKECPWPRIVQCMPNIGKFTLSLTRLRQPCRDLSGELLFNRGFGCLCWNVKKICSILYQLQWTMNVRYARHYVDTWKLWYFYWCREFYWIPDE